VIIEGSQARAGILDPLGATLDAGPGAYFQLMRDMVASFKRCFLQGS
jgi:zinc transport system substrate-binding protein